jgi:flagellar motor component MotA
MEPKAERAIGIVTAVIGLVKVIVSLVKRKKEKEPEAK